MLSVESVLRRVTAVRPFRWIGSLLLALVVVATAPALAPSGVVGTTHAAVPRGSMIQAATQLPLTSTADCPLATAGHMACMARRLDSKGQPVRPDLARTGSATVSSSSLLGYSPQQIQAAYDLPSTYAGGGVTVGVIDAYNNPTAQGDLATYRAQWGLPPCGAGCFSVVGESGSSASLPTAEDAGWSQESDLDIETVSAACPLCHIILVEANSDGSPDLLQSVDTAVSLGAQVVNLSFGGPEWSAEALQGDPYLDHPGVAVVAAAGDSGPSAEYPATSPDVISVGGTTLVPAATGRGWSETAWANTGSGCSAFEVAPAWQVEMSDAARCTQNAGRPGRVDNDLSADADPNTGLAVYDSQASVGGWAVEGGTSLATPIIAAAYALEGGSGPGAIGASSVYSEPSVFDVTSGSTSSCGILCTAGPGWDGPTGLGSPDGPPVRIGGALGRYRGPQGLHWVTTGQVSAGYIGNDPGHQESTLGTLSNAGGSGFQALFSCAVGEGHFLSLDSGCEGQQFIDLDGYAATTASVQYPIEIFRCRVPFNGDHFVSTDPNCEGQATEGSLGYVGSVVALNRYRGPTGHLGTTGDAPSSFLLDGELGTISSSPIAGAAPLYECGFGVSYFTSASPTCEGQKMMSLLGYIDTSQLGGTVPLYRCRLGGVHFDTTSASCEGSGAVLEGILGFIA